MRNGKSGLMKKDTKIISEFGSYKIALVGINIQSKHVKFICTETSHLILL